ncbi:MAG TPA: hypothetical protein VGT05_01450 [Patescibacteria group bacterium]|nr:hypothetical protein [Patescibacteria group bacterium]
MSYKHYEVLPFERTGEGLTHAIANIVLLSSNPTANIEFLERIEKTRRGISNMIITRRDRAIQRKATYETQRWKLVLEQQLPMHSSPISPEVVTEFTAFEGEPVLVR